MKHYLIALAIFGLGSTYAEPDVSTDWKSATRKGGLSEKAIAQLDENRILVTNEAYKQIFDAYLGGKQNPVFITSDSLLNAYHTLYEESISRLESMNASRLQEFLRTVLENIDNPDTPVLTGHPTWVAESTKRAKLVVGIALRLMDDSFRFNEEKLDHILEEETGRIVLSEGHGMPQWLGVPTPSFMGIDYNRYMPRGFYASSERLSRYFRASSWLQSIPFRINYDEEFLAMVILGAATLSDDIVKPIDYTYFLGQADNLDIFNARPNRWQLPIDLLDDDLDRMGSEYIEASARYGKGKINDIEPSFRILSAYQTPSAVLFRQTTDPDNFKRELPSGLEIAIALGSDHSRNLLKETETPKVLHAIDHREPNLFGIDESLVFKPWSSLYFSYLNVLRTLVDKPEPDCPDFMRQDAWKLKSINTLLGSWAQMCHTWALQAKQSIEWMCATDDPVGFVEPEPEFFARMANLADATKGTLKFSGAFEPNYSFAIENLRFFETTCDKFKTWDEFGDHFHSLSNDDQSQLLLAYNLQFMGPSAADHDSPQNYKESVAWIKTVRRDIETGLVDKHLLIRKHLNLQGRLAERWELLHFICMRL